MKTPDVLESVHNFQQSHDTERGNELSNCTTHNCTAVFQANTVNDVCHALSHRRLYTELRDTCMASTAVDALYWVRISRERERLF
jgi:hypothetical protein